MIKSQKDKNIALLALLLVLSIAAFWAFGYNPYAGKSTSFDKELFAVNNPDERLTKVSMQSASVNNTLEKKNGQWWVNDAYQLDPSMKEVLMALLERIAVQREVSGEEKDRIQEHMLDTGIQVKMYSEEGLFTTFTAGGNPTTVSSYFVQEDHVYSMHLPGYESYVAGIFEVKENDWRDRTIFEGDWQDIVSLTIAEPGKDTLKFKYQGGLIKWQHPESDSVKVMNFVEQFNYFYVDQFLSETNEVFNYKEQFEWRGRIKIEVLNPSKSLDMVFYRVPDFNAVLVKFKDEWGAMPIARADKFFPEAEALKK